MFKGSIFHTGFIQSCLPFITLPIATLGWAFRNWQWVICRLDASDLWIFCSDKFVCHLFFCGESYPKNEYSTWKKLSTTPFQKTDRSEHRFTPVRKKNITACHLPRPNGRLRNGYESDVFAVWKYSNLLMANSGEYQIQLTIRLYSRMV